MAAVGGGGGRKAEAAARARHLHTPPSSPFEDAAAVKPICEENWLRRTGIDGAAGAVAAFTSAAASGQRL